MQEHFPISKYIVCLCCSQVELLRKTFCITPEWMFYDVLTDFLPVASFILSMTLLICLNLSTGLFIADLLGVYLHSDSTCNSHRIVITPAVRFSPKARTVLTPWSLFMILLPEKVYSSKITELRDINYSDTFYVVR